MPRLPASEKKKVNDQVKLHIGSGTSPEISNTIGKELSKLTPKLYNETVKVLEKTGQADLTGQQKAEIIDKVTKGSGQSGGLAPLLIGLLTAAAYKAVDSLVPLAVDFVRSKVMKGKGSVLAGNPSKGGGVMLSGGSLSPITMAGDVVSLQGDGIALSGNTKLRSSKVAKPARVHRMDGGAMTKKKHQIQVVPISETQPQMDINSYAI